MGNKLNSSISTSLDLEMARGLKYYKLCQVARVMCSWKERSEAMIREIARKIRTHNCRMNVK